MRDLFGKLLIGANSVSHFTIKLLTYYKTGIGSHIVNEIENNLAKLERLFETGKWGLKRDDFLEFLKSLPDDTIRENVPLFLRGTAYQGNESIVNSIAKILNRIEPESMLLPLAEGLRDSERGIKKRYHDGLRTVIDIIWDKLKTDEDFANKFRETVLPIFLDSHTDRDSYFRFRGLDALRILGKIRPEWVESMKPAILAGLDDEDEGNIHWANLAVSDLVEYISDGEFRKAAVSLLLKSLQSNNNETAADALGALGPDAKEALYYLEERMEDGYIEYRQIAERAIARIRKGAS